MKKIFKFFIIVISFFIVSIILFGLYFNSAINNKKNESFSIEDLKELSKRVKDDRINILLLGVDHLDISQEHQNMRTDTMMLFSIDPKTKTAFILSIPRDTRARIEGYRYKYNKINSAYSLGGINFTLKAVKDLLNIPINHFVEVDYGALKKTVDDIGGVEVNVPMDMHYEDPYAKPPLVIDLKKGVQILDGQKSMEFLRFRKGYQNQDLGRIEAQQQFVKSLINKALSVESIKNIPDFIETFYKYVETDMTMVDMLKIASKAIDIKPYNIKREVLVGEPNYNKYKTAYYLTDSEKVKAQIDDLLAANYYIDEETYNKQLEESQAKSNPTIEEMKENKKEKKEIPTYVVVLNGDGRPGLAKRATDLLYVNNINVDLEKNADNFKYKYTTIYYKDSEDAKELAKRARDILEVGKLKQENMAYNGKATDILIVLGNDFVK